MKTFVLYLVTILLCMSAAVAQWTHDPYSSVVVDSQDLGEAWIESVTDMSGGIIVAWAYAYSDSFIYAQRVNEKGIPQWGANGIVVSDKPRLYESISIINDDAGGAIIAWVDWRNGPNDIYAQRISALGTAMWLTNGIPVCISSGTEQNISTVNDGASGAIIVWQDDRAGTVDVYAQRINDLGVVQWTTNGIVICNATGYQGRVDAITNNLGGVYIVWSDYRSGGGGDIYGQSINSSGEAQWTLNGRVLGSGPEDQETGKITTDGSDGFHLVYSQNSDVLVYSHVNSNGVDIFSRSLTSNLATDDLHSLKSDGNGGAIIAFLEVGTFAYSLKAQRINSFPTLLWGENHITLQSDLSILTLPEIVNDNDGGAFIVWSSEEDPGGFPTRDIYGQHINSSGIVQWNEGRRMIADRKDNFLDDQGSYYNTVSDGNGGALVSWVDVNSFGYNYGTINANKIDHNGFMGDNMPNLVSVRDVPEDQGGKVKILWDKSYLDKRSAQTITSYSIWRGIEENAVTGKTRISSPNQITEYPMNSIYRTRESSSGTTYWEWIAGIPSHYLEQYSYIAQTFTDSSGSGIPYYKFFVSAHASDQFVFWDSNIDSGYSVDNIQPAAVTQLMIEIIETPSSVSKPEEVQSASSYIVKASWTNNTEDPDISHYELHRSAVAGFTPTVETYLGQTTDTVFYDYAPLAGVVNHYLLVTVDIHGNQSVLSPETESHPGAALMTLNDKWNIVSVPLTVGEYSKNVLYSPAISDAFRYLAGYQSQGTLTNGAGYWLKFSGEQTVTMVGYPRESDSITVAEGWNMIGSISSPVEVSEITSQPPGLVMSQFFGYSNGYSPSATIEPGKGYWVKATQAGTLYLSSSGMKSSASIVIKTINELPPTPPGEVHSDIPILPIEFSLSQNYPNPFNPTTLISYALPVESYVTLRVYNILGEEVATLVDGMQESGFKSLSWDANGVASGMYIYRITAGPFSETKRMLLLR